VPLSDTDCEVAGAATVTANVDVFTPAAVGVNVTLMVQVAPAAKLAGQVLVWANCPRTLPPVTAMVLIVSGATDPVFVTVTTLAGLVVLTVWVPKASEVGDRV
jgi:hypothetical protein